MDNIVKYFLVFLILTTSLISKEYTIKMVSGGFRVKNGSTWIKRNNNVKLKDSDIIEINKSGYISFIDDNGNIYEVNKSGKYSVAKIICLKNTKGKNVSKKVLNENFININVDYIGMLSGSCYYWSVLYNDEPTGEYCIQVLTEEDNNDLISEYNKLKEEIDVESSIGQLSIAMFYKKHKITYKAIEAFKNAIDISPEVKTFKTIYIKYLIEIGLYDEADTLIKTLIEQ